jgi:hypothetical protein
MRVLILGGRAPVALELARRFASQGHAVLVGDSVSCRISGASRAVLRTLPLLPPPRTHLREFAAALARHIDREHIDLVIPTCEEVFFLSRIRHRLPARCAAFTAQFALLQQLHSKLGILALATQAGVRVPDSAAVDTIAEARAWAGARDVVLKPEYSRFGVHVRSHEGGIPRAAPPLAPLGRWVVQQRCKGTELCSYAIAFRGRLCLNISYRPAYRLARSSSYYFDPHPVPEIDAAIARLVALTGYHGQISFDWFLDTEGGPTLIECNPRAVSGLHLLPDDADVCSAMLEGQQAQAATITDGRSVSPDRHALQPRMLSAIMLGAGLPRAVATGRVPQWWRDWRRARDVLAVPGDRAPLAGALRDLGAFARAALRSGCSLREASTRDIEWDGEPLLE